MPNKWSKSRQVLATASHFWLSLQGCTLESGREPGLVHVLSRSQQSFVCAENQCFINLSSLWHTGRYSELCLSSSITIACNVICSKMLLHSVTLNCLLFVGWEWGICHVSIIYKSRAKKVWRVFPFPIMTTVFVVLIFYVSFAFYFFNSLWKGELPIPSSKLIPDRSVTMANCWYEARVGWHCRKHCGSQLSAVGLHHWTNSSNYLLCCWWTSLGYWNSVNHGCNPRMC